MKLGSLPPEDQEWQAGKPDHVIRYIFNLEDILKEMKISKTNEQDEQDILECEKLIEQVKSGEIVPDELSENEKNYLNAIHIVVDRYLEEDFAALLFSSFTQLRIDYLNNKYSKEEAEALHLLLSNRLKAEDPEGPL